MSSFLGTYRVRIDNKGRINVPARFRANIEVTSNPQLVSVIMEGYLILFPQHEWEASEERLVHLSALSPDERNEMRKYYARASECELKSGKLLLPQSQRDSIHLSGTLVLVGMSRTFEVWPEELWSAQGFD